MKFIKTALIIAMAAFVMSCDPVDNPTGDNTDDPIETPTDTTQTPTPEVPVDSTETPEPEIPVVEKPEVQENAWSIIGNFAGFDYDADFYMTEFPAGSGIYQTQMLPFRAGDEFYLRFNNSDDKKIGVDGGVISWPDIRTLSNAIAKNFTPAVENGGNIVISEEQAGEQVVVYDSNLGIVYLLGWAFIGEVEGSDWDLYLPLVIYEDAVRMTQDGQFVIFNVLFEGEWQIWDGISRCKYGINPSEEIDGEDMYPMNTMRLPVPNTGVGGGDWVNTTNMNATVDGDNLHVEGEWVRKYRFVIMFGCLYKELPGDFAMTIELPEYDDSIDPNL